MKGFRISAMLMAATMLLTSCAAAPDAPAVTPGASEAKNSASGAVDTKAPVTIVYESYGPTKETMDRILESFKVEHPEITVEVILHANLSEYMSAVQTAFASGEGPDVFQYDSPTALGQLKSQIEPLDAYCVKEWGDAWAKDFAASALEDNSLDKIVYGLPAPCAPAGTMWYNKTLLDSLNLKVPTNYAELKTAADALRAAGKQPLLMGAKDSWIVIDTFQTILNEFAGDKQYRAYNKEIDFTDPDIVASFEMWEKLFTDKIFQDSAFSMTQYMDTYNQFNDEGIAGMWANGGWNMDMYTNAEIAGNVAKSEWGVAFFPDLNGDGKQPALLSVSGGYAMNKNSKAKDAAWELVKFMSCGDGAVFECERSMAPSSYLKMKQPTYNVPENAKQNLATITELLSSSTPQFRGINNPKVAEKLCEVLTKVAYHEMTPADAAAAVDAVIKA